jgi:hypothetical protein
MSGIAIMHDELGRIWKEGVMAYLRTSTPFCGRTGK